MSTTTTTTEAETVANGTPKNDSDASFDDVIKAIEATGWTINDVIDDYQLNLDKRIEYVDTIAKVYNIPSARLVRFIKARLADLEDGASHSAVMATTNAIFGRPLGLAMPTSPSRASSRSLHGVKMMYDEMAAVPNGRGRPRGLSIELPPDADEFKYADDFDEAADAEEALVYGHKVAATSPIAKNSASMFSAPVATGGVKRVPGQMENAKNHKDYQEIGANDCFEVARSLVAEHNSYMSKRIDMVASNSVVSMFVRGAMASMLPNSYSAGKFGDRVYGGCEYIDMLEREAILAAHQLYKFPYVYVHFLSGMQANHAAFHALLRPGMVVMSALPKHGGHYSHSSAGAMRYYGVEVVPVPFDDKTYNIDVDRLEAAMAAERRVDLLIVGWSEFLFPHDLARIRKITKKFNTKIMYDMSHVAGLIAGGVFQSPDDISQYCDVLTSSTGKSLHSVDHGILMFHDPALMKRVDEAVLPVLTSNSHCQEMCALAITLLEMKQYGRAYGEMVQKNSQRLGAELKKRGVKVLYEHLGYSKSHQVLVEVGVDPGPMAVLRRLELAGVLCSTTLLPWDSDSAPSGIRLGTQVLTRRGFLPDDMAFVAQIVSDVLVRDENEHTILTERVEPFMNQARFKEIRFSFDAEKFKPGLEWADQPFADSIDRATFSKEAVLRSVRPFHACTVDQLSVIQRLVHLCSSGEDKVVPIVKRGTVPSGVLILVRGEIELVTMSDGDADSSGIMSVETFRSRGASLLVDDVLSGKRATYMAVARSNTMWIYVPEAAFRWMLENVASVQRFYGRFTRDTNAEK